MEIDFLPTLPSLLARPGAPLIHRDLSWLQFNDRVLAEARQATNPLLERVKFLAISGSNLDEFFMIRFGSLSRAAQTDASPQGHLRKIRDNVLETVAKFGAKQLEAYDLLTSELELEGVRLARQPSPEDPIYAVGQRIFDEQILPKLAPPEEFAVAKVGMLENLQIGAVFPNPAPNPAPNLVPNVAPNSAPNSGAPATLGGSPWFRIPKTLPQIFLAWDADAKQAVFFCLDDLLALYLGKAFRLASAPAFLKLTRDGDFTVDLEEEDTESIPDVVRTGLGTRDKGRPMRLQYAGDASGTLLNQCAQNLKLESGQILPAPGSLCLSGLWTVVNQTPDEIAAKPGLRYPITKPGIPARLTQRDRIFAEIARQDLLMHHPYDSFDGFVNWIQAACEDPNVERIEQTVYRMDALSAVMAALKSAAQAGKRVGVIIELRARFDELNNLSLADELRKAGVEVAFGFGKLKLHAKVALVTRLEPDGPDAGQRKLYTHLSTGNYNAHTARTYTDLAILTAHPEIGSDARLFFDSVWEGAVPTAFKQLVPAPTKLHKLLLQLIQAETAAARAGRVARVVAKVNALVDPVVIDALYEASRAGVRVDLIVRGACSLIPGVKGLSDNIRVVSVVDRFLEHSRIYFFGDSKQLYLSSADWMPRNFFSRLEIAFPVQDPRLRRYIEEIVIPAYLADTVKARELTPQGTWKKRGMTQVRGALGGTAESVFGKKPVRSQWLFQELAVRGYKGTPLE